MSAEKGPPRIVMVANRHQQNDGQGRVNYEIALAALNSGMHVTLLTAYCADEIANHPQARLVKIGKEGRPTQLWKNLAFARESARWLRIHRGQYDLVQANGFITWADCDIVTAHFVHTSWGRSPYFQYARSWRPGALYQRLFTALNARWEQRAFRAAKFVIAVSEIVAKDVEALGVPHERIRVVHNGVDTDEFAPGASVRGTFGLPDDVPMVLFAGDIRSPRKNLQTLLRAMGHLPNVHLAVAGDTMRSAAPALARELDLGDRVHFLGKTTRLPELMRSVDVFAFPSLYEPFGLVALEAAASGLPAVLSHHVGSAGALQGVFTIVKDAEDAAELAAAIDNLLQSATRREEMAQRARDRALSLQWKDTAAGYLRIYQEMVQRQEMTERRA
ncbi:MAG TPA: glycosyltransferase family 4 protein [Acidobacteriaceae bacterium]|jgi:glycosyltransferase involved in cell wall biosynthesis